MTKILCIYHGNCADGFGAAWAVRQALGDEVEFHPGVYQSPPPDVTDRDVIMVDFSYKRPVLNDIADMARSVLILDHHKSAADDLADFPPAPDTWGAWLEYADVTGDNAAALFDMDRSGAMIAWNFFHPGKEPPRLLEHIQDRDLWRFDLPGTREVQAALFSLPYDFEVWDDLMTYGGIPDRFYRDGVAIERKHFKDINELLAVMQTRMTIGGHDVPVVNLPYTLSSDAGHKMAHGEPFAACYYRKPDGWEFSLRSSDDGMDVSEIAKLYGGGGHRNAAGFRVSDLGDL